MMFRAIVKNPNTPRELLQDLICMRYVSSVDYLKEIRAHPNYSEVMEVQIKENIRKVKVMDAWDRAELAIIENGIRNGEKWGSIVKDVNNIRK